MKMRKRGPCWLQAGAWFCLLGAAGLFAWSWLVAAPDQPGARLGQPAPRFQVTGISGQRHDLTTLRGNYVVLEWTNPRCNCVSQHYQGYMQRLQQQMISRGVIWLMVNSAHPSRDGHLSAAQAAAWLNEKAATPSDYIVDAEGTLGRLFGAKSTPTAVVLDPEGRVIYRGGVDNNPEGNPAKFATAVNYVRNALEDAWAGRTPQVSSAPAYGCAVKYQLAGTVEAVGSTR